MSIERWSAAKVDEGWEHDEKVFEGPPAQKEE
jgi:hypothetical protein